MELVRDEHDRRAPLLEAPQDLLEFLHALGRQHGRGLVKDQHPGSAPEGADDLDLLLAAQFSPSRQCTSPCRTVRLTRSFARTPGNRFVISVSSMAGARSGDCVPATPASS